MSEFNLFRRVCRAQLADGNVQPAGAKLSNTVTQPLHKLKKLNANNMHDVYVVIVIYLQTI